MRKRAAAELAEMDRRRGPPASVSWKKSECLREFVANSKHLYMDPLSRSITLPGKVISRATYESMEVALLLYVYAAIDTAAPELAIAATLF